MQEYKLIIAGGCDFDNYMLLQKSVNKALISKIHDHEVIVVSGVCKGADMLGERYACEMGYEVAEFPACDTEDRQCCHLRQKEMVEFSDGCICFWDGKPNNTKDMIDVATNLKLVLTVINY